MAQIPRGEGLGQVDAQPQRAVDVPAGAFGENLFTGIGRAAGAGIQEMQRQQDERQRAADALASARTVNALHDAHDQVATGVADGSIPLDKVQSEFQARTDKVRTAALGQVSDPAHRDVLDAHIQTAMGTLQRNLAGVVQKRQQGNTIAQIDQFGEEMGRTAMRTGPQAAVSAYSEYVRTAGPAGGLDEKGQQALVQKFREKVHADYFRQQGVDALTRGDVAGLQKLRQDVTGAAGEPLDPKQRAAITHTLFGWEQSLLARQDRAANQAAEEQRKAYNEAVDIFNKGTDVALSGGYFSPEFIQEMATKAAGTDMEKPVANLIASQRTVAGFASLPAPERAALIERTRAARATPGVGTDPLSDKLLSAMEAMDGKLKTAVQENPWSAAQRAGVIQDAPQISAAAPESAISIVQSRMQSIGNVEAWAGQKVSPLQPQEVDQVAKMVRSLPLDQAATMLGQFGAAVGDSERVAALAKQLHDKDGTLGLAMLYANAGTSEGRHTAELVLRGEQAIKDKTAAIDNAKETGWRGTIAKSVRGAYANREAEDAAVQAAFLIAAGKYADGKGADLEQAVKLATGGIAERNGQKFPLPYGMTERDFNQRVESIKPADLSAQAPDGQVFVGRTPMPVDAFVASLPKATLVHAGQGAYNVRAGAALVTNARGQRITLRIAP